MALKTYEGTKDAVETRDGGYGWVVAFSGMVITLLNGGAFYTSGIFFVEFVQYFQQGTEDSAWIGAVAGSIYSFTGPISAALTNKLGARVVIMIGGLLSLLGFVLSVFAPSLTVLYFTFGGLVGMLIASPLFNFLIEIFGWRGAVLIIGGINANTMVCAALMRPVNAKRVDRQKQDSSKSAETAEQNVINYADQNKQNGTEDPRNIHIRMSDENSYQPLIAVSMRELVGAENMGIAFGWDYFFMGVGYLLGPVFSGWLFDVTGNYELSFYITGGLTVTGGLLLFVAPNVKAVMLRSCSRDGQKDEAVFELPTNLSNQQGVQNPSLVDEYTTPGE
ncbi:monocarboxylate transporter 12-B-like [Glandiceps talaboti]